MQAQYDGIDFAALLLVYYSAYRTELTRQQGDVMRQTLLMAAFIGGALLIGEARAMDNSQYDYKLSKFLQEQKAEHMAEAMEAIGADLSNVTIEIRYRGTSVTLNGTVPTQGDLDRVNRVIEKFGPFKNARNYVKVKPYEAQDGIVVELDVFKHIPKPTEEQPGETNDCPVCAASGSCEKLYAEREELLKQLRPLVKRQINDRYVVFDKKAAEPLKQFCQISDLLDTSLCYKPTGAQVAKTAKPAEKSDYKSAK